MNIIYGHDIGKAIKSTANKMWKIILMVGIALIIIVILSDFVTIITSSKLLSNVKVEDSRLPIGTIIATLTSVFTMLIHIIEGIVALIFTRIGFMCLYGYGEFLELKNIEVRKNKED
jgi:hypothetical protein